MVIALIYTSRLLYKESVTSLYANCADEVSVIATDLSYYLNTSETILWVTGDSVDQMLSAGIDQEKIHEYIRVETAHQTETLDENFMGLYGVIRGDYLDGLDWVPPTGYDPTKRSWYTLALEAGGDATIIPPYIDAQTGDVIISVSKMLTDQSSVLSVDVSLNHIQETVSQMNIDGNGYGMIIDRNGMIVSHHDINMNGRYCKDLFGDNSLLNAVLSTGSGHTKVMIDGSEYTMFIAEVLDQWYTVVLVQSNELLSKIYLKLIVNICVYTIIFFLISFFYHMSHMNEKKASKMMEELNMEDIPKLFESFERLDKEKNRNIEGTGLGMSIVTKLLAMMGSELSVESEYGVGSTFSFVIEQGIVEKTEIGKSYTELNEGTKKEAKPAVYQESFHAPECRVLIVDDTKMNLKVVSNLLKKTQMMIDTSLSGEDALKLCEQNKYDVILMDQRMPGMDGTETLAHIRAQQNGLNAKTPVICLAADAISGARDRYLADGFSDYLSKPVESRELEKMLFSFLPADKMKH